MDKWYNQILSLVCRVTRVSPDEIFKSNREEIVDARYILLYKLSEYFTDIEMAKMCGVSRELTNKVRRSFEPKLKKFSFRCKYSEVCREFAEIESAMKLV